jgi:hypothetical protein
MCKCFTETLPRPVESEHTMDFFEIFIGQRWLSLQTSFLAGVSLYFLYSLIVYIYRVTLHPLAKFPGPMLAGASFWYEFYYDVWPRKYRYMWKIDELHKKYGEFESEVYTSTKTAINRPTATVYNADD